MRASRSCLALFVLAAPACGGADDGQSAGDTSAAEASSSAGTSASVTGTSASTTVGESSGGPGTTGTSATTTTTGADGSSDGGSSDTGDQGRDYGNDRDKFFGDPHCDVPDLLLCDSFEDGALDTRTWEPINNVTVVSDKAARGSGSLHVHADQNGWSGVRETLTFPAPDNTYFGRMFVWIDAVPIAPDWAHWTLVGAAGSGDTSEIRVGGQYNPFAGMNLFGVGTDGGPTGDWTNLDDDPTGAPMAVVVQDWVCIEWMHDGANDETRFWWDADEHLSLATTATMHGGNQGANYVMPEFESVWVGWWLYQTGPNPDHYDVWIDEVAIDAIRIGCIY